MRAEINEKGCLTVSPETPLELYALIKWYEEWDAPAGESRSVLLIDTSVAGVGEPKVATPPDGAEREE